MPTHRGLERPRTVEAALQGAESMCRWLASRYYAPGCDFDDLLQEARIGVLKAWRDYRPPYAWLSFAKLCAERQVVTAVKTAQRAKHRLLNEAASLNAVVDSRDEDASTLLDVVVGGPAPHDVLEPRWELLRLARLARETLSPLEWVALSLLLDGRPYSEVKALDNAVLRARRKLRAAA